MSQPNILLFGAGAIGAVYLHTFQRAGCYVTAVCRSNYAAVQATGFSLLSIRFGNVHFRPDAVVRTATEAASLSKHWDFIVVCSKCFPGSKPGLSDQLRPVVQSPETAIVLVQNGIGIEDEVSADFPENPLLSCVIYLPSTQTSPGVIDYGYTQKETLNMLEIGTFPSAAPKAHKDAAERLAELVQKGGGGAKVFDDVQVQRWSKLIVNAAWNPITALSLCNDADFLRSSPGAIEEVRNVMFEVVAIAQKLGVEGIDRQVAETHLQRHAKRTVGKEPSMLVDVLMGRPFEVEAIVGNTVRIAREVGVEVPRLDMLYVLAKGLFEAGFRKRAEGRGVDGKEKEKMQAEAEAKIGGA